MPGHSQQEGPHWFGSWAPSLCGEQFREGVVGGLGAAPWMLCRPRVCACPARDNKHRGASTQASGQRLQLVWPKLTDQVRSEQRACSLGLSVPSGNGAGSRRPTGPLCSVAANTASQACKAFRSLSWERKGRRLIGCGCGTLPSTPQEPSTLLPEASKGSCCLPRSTQTTARPVGRLVWPLASPALPAAPALPRPMARSSVKTTADPRLSQSRRLHRGLCVNYLL